MFVFNQDSGYLIEKYLGGGYRKKFTDIDRMNMCAWQCAKHFILIIYPQVVPVYSFIKQETETWRTLPKNP